MSWDLFPLAFRGLTVSIRNIYVKVHEAAEILGVAPNTIRAWGATGKIPEHRHPANGYRLYKRADLQAVIQQIERSVGGEPAAKQGATKKRKTGRTKAK